MSDVVGILSLVITVVLVTLALVVYYTVVSVRELKRSLAHDRIWKTQILMILRDSTVYQRSVSDYLGTMCCVFERMEECEDLDKYDEKGVELL